MGPASTLPEPTLIVMGSARANGNTRRAVDRLCAGLRDRVTLVDLLSERIEPFSYGSAPDRDRFLFVIDRMLAHERIVFATPVYWYAMSGLMKTLFDRLTDLLSSEAHRPLGRALAGRNVWLLATGTDRQLPRGFEEPFARTATYLGMVWRQACYVRSIRGAPPEEPQLAPVDELVRSLSGGEHAPDTLPPTRFG